MSGRAVDSESVPWKEVVLERSRELWLSVQLTIDQMNVGPGSGEVPVIKDREGAGVRPGVPHHGVGDDQDAGDQLPWHLHSHAKQFISTGCILKCVF